MFRRPLWIAVAILLLIAAAALIAPRFGVRLL